MAERQMTVRMSEGALNTMRETLEMDTQSKVFDRELREEIRLALDGMHVVDDSGNPSMAKALEAIPPSWWGTFLPYTHWCEGCNQERKTSLGMTAFNLIEMLRMDESQADQAQTGCTPVVNLGDFDICQRCASGEDDPNEAGPLVVHPIEGL